MENEFRRREKNELFYKTKVFKNFTSQINCKN